MLFVTPYLPSPPGFGGQRRMHGMISALARDHHVSLLSLVDPAVDQQASIEATRAYCRRVVTVPNARYAAGGAHKRLYQLRSLLSSHSYEHLVHAEPALQRALDRMLAEESFDAVHIEFAQIASIVARRPGPGPLFLLDEHNIEYDIIRRTAETEGSPLRRGYSSLNWRKLRAEERRAWSWLDGCTLTSVRDQQLLLADAPALPTAVVPNGVDLEAFRPAGPRPTTDPPTVLFFGALDYYPNTDGLLFFLNEVMPLLRKSHPLTRLRIVGRRPPESLQAFRGPDVELTGAVDDVYPHIEAASVVIAPLRIGGGTRLKILEAMATERPVVSTTLGAEGIDLVPGRDALLADDPADFARQVGRLLDDHELASQVAAAGRRLVAERYGWRASVEQLEAFYDRLLGERRVRP